MHIAQNWRLNAQRYALKGTKCAHCGKVSFPPRPVCPHCEAQQTMSFEFARASLSPVTEQVALPKAAR